MAKRIKVKYEVFGTRYLIERALKSLEQYDVLSFDTETKGVYPKAERELATKLLKDDSLSTADKRDCLLVSNNSGLSYPSLIATTHFVFGFAEDESIVIVCNDPQTELLIWNWVAEFSGKLIVHNTLFDLKIMYHRIKKLPKNYVDSALIVKCYINNSNVWKAKVGLKDLMGQYYSPRWSEYENYEPDNLRDPAFLEYAATDGAATIKLWHLILEMEEPDE